MILKTAQLLAKDIGVDSGTIMVSDMAFYTPKPKPRDPRTPDGLSLYKTLDVPSGLYECVVSIGKTWNGRVEVKGDVLITTGKLVVSDPCYLYPSEYWGKLLGSTDYLRSPPAGTVVMDKMGGDGVYNVKVKLKLKGQNKNDR